MERKLRGEDIYPEWQGYKQPKTPLDQHLVYMLGHVGTPFTTPQGARFLSYPWGDGCCFTTSLSNPAIRLAAIREYTQKFGLPPRETALRSAFRTFQAQATTQCYDVCLRIGEYSGNIHIDPAWPAGKLSGHHIEITPDGWTTRRNRIRTILPATAAPQPELEPPTATPPDPLTALDPLRRLLRLDNDRPAWLRVLVWLFAAFRPPAESTTVAPTPRDHPILQISGPAGSGKTSAARILRSLVDPSAAPINFTPANEAAAGRIARDNHVVLIDGVTRLARRPAEVLARLSTGLPAKFHGEMQNLSRPILLTTNEPGAADRLASRVLPIELPALPSPLPQDELQKRFESQRPAILSALLTLLSTALRRLPETPCPENARFPEAVQWAAAALDTLDPNELICVTQPQNNFEAALTDLLASRGAGFSRPEWKGTATELKAALDSPLTPRALSQKLDEIQSLCVTRTRTGRLRTITLSFSVSASPPKPSPHLPIPIRVHSCSLVAKSFPSTPYKKSLSLSAGVC